MKAKAHSLKGACGYVGASRMHYACYFIQEAYQMQQYDLMVEKYPRLVETVIEFKRFSRKILAEHRGEPYEEQPDAREVDIAIGYRLEHNESDDTYYCMRDG